VLHRTVQYLFIYSILLRPHRKGWDFAVGVGKQTAHRTGLCGNEHIRTALKLDMHLLCLVRSVV
jgi:hypothetical protein